MFPFDKCNPRIFKGAPHKQLPPDAQSKVRDSLDRLGVGDLEYVQCVDRKRDLAAFSSATLSNLGFERSANLVD